MCDLSSLLSLSLVSPLSLSATVQLSPGHRAEPANPRPSCRRAGPSAPATVQPAGNQTGYCWAGFNGKAAVVGRLPPHPDAVVFAGVAPVRDIADPGRLDGPLRLTADDGQTPDE